MKTAESLSKAAEDRVPGPAFKVHARHERAVRSGESSKRGVNT